MRNTPSALKWMVNERARLAADVIRLEKVETEVAMRLAQARDSLAAIDKTICLHTKNADPTSIKPVSATEGKYGKHGALRGSIERVLRGASPEAIATDELAMLLVLELGLNFDLGAGGAGGRASVALGVVTEGGAGVGASPSRARWVKNSLSPTLRALVADGVVERVHDATVFTSEVGRWRLKVEKQPTMKELRERAAAALPAKAAARSKEAGATKAAGAMPAADGGERASGKRKVRFRF